MKESISRQKIEQVIAILKRAELSLPLAEPIGNIVFRIGPAIGRRRCAGSWSDRTSPELRSQKNVHSIPTMLEEPSRLLFP